MGELKSSTDSLVGIFKPLKKLRYNEHVDAEMIDTINVLIEDYMEKYSIE